MPEEVLGPVVLVVPVGVVHRVEPLIAQRDLPHHGRAPDRGRHRTEVLLPPLEVREGNVQAVPPHVLPDHVLVVAGIAVRNVVEHEVVAAGTGRDRELARLAAVGSGVERRVRARSDVLARRPVADVGGEQDIGRVHIAEVLQRQHEPAEGVGVTGNVGVAGAGDGCLHERRVVPGPRAEAVAEVAEQGRLLGVAGEIRFDVDDGRLAITGDAVPCACAESPHQHPEVVEVGLHHGGRVQVGEVALRLTATVAGPIALQELVVGKDRDIAVGRGALRVPERELGRRVPRLPTLPRVHARRQVLIGVVEGNARVGHPPVDATVVGLGRQPDAKVSRQGSRNGQ